MINDYTTFHTVQNKGIAWEVSLGAFAFRIARPQFLLKITINSQSSRKLLLFTT